MKNPWLYITLTAFLLAALAGCQTVDFEQDLADITDLLLASYFTGEGSDGVIDDSTSQIQASTNLLLPAPDTGHQLWKRVITEFHRDVNINEEDIEGDSAFAVITNHLVGTIYVLNLADTTIYEHPIDDSTYREVILKREKRKRLFGGWVIDKITPAKIWTNDPAHEVKIDSIVISSSSGENLTIDDPGEFFGKDDIPWFTPNDEVTVEVWQQDTGEEAWGYLHHGRHFRRKFLHHRKVFDRDTTNTLYFKGIWTTADDNLLGQDITVRHAAIDLILAETLDGDSTATYSAYAIALPYVIAKEGLELPDDGAEDND